MIPYVIIMVIGNFVVAYGYEKKFDWKVNHTNATGLTLWYFWAHPNAELALDNCDRRLRSCGHPSRRLACHCIHLRR